ncbi:MAG: hypothetical protein AAF331_04385 [Pseudomonadota bacterium]
MHREISIWMVGLALGLTACGNGTSRSDGGDEPVRPDQFALMPCDPGTAIPCTLVVAGGKRILFGAPAGVTHALRSDDLRQLDAVAIFSLTALDLQGLDEVRNLSWHAGRSEPLPVIGPAGIEDTVAALNKAFEQADALYVVEHGIPVGGYDAAILTARAATENARVFDTGDLIVVRSASGYRIDYRSAGKTQVAWLKACDAPDELALIGADVERVVTVACSGDVADHQWPITAPIFIEK